MSKSYNYDLKLVTMYKRKLQSSLNNVCLADKYVKNNIRWSWTAIIKTNLRSWRVILQ